MNDGPKRDWEKSRLHFICGAVVGAILGAYLCFSPMWLNSDSWRVGLAFILGTALLVGFLAGFFLDDFWEKFLEWFRWW